MRLRLGMVQLLVEGGEPERNLARAEEWIAKAAASGCQIVLLPETLDLVWTHPSAKTEAQPIPGPYSDRLCAAAAKHGITICAGLTEKDGDKVYNSALLIDDKGNILLKHRKINILRVCYEFYAPGRKLEVVETPFGLIGVNICSDNYSDALELAHSLARMGAQIILSPSSWTVDYSVTEANDPYGEKWFKPYHTIASLYDLVVAGATSVGYIVGGPYEGKKSVGRSLCVGKDGIIAEGRFNEFATDLVVAEFEVPPPHEVGTAIGEMLKAKGHYR
ncbi:MAG: carbon-nitrogen hydrolase family protein [Actinomycetota bacterium]